jgi:predicted  nucleic acid-binding Zn-ribbon protein
MTADSTSASSHATIRETYDLVSDTRQELNERIDGLGEKFDAFVTSNEHRLTILETHQGAQADQLVQVSSRLDDHGRAISYLKDKQKEDEASAEALEEESKNRWSTHSTLVTVVASVVLALATALSVFGVKLY